MQKYERPVSFLGVEWGTARLYFFILTNTELQYDAVIVFHILAKRQVQLKFLPPSYDKAIVVKVVTGVVEAAILLSEEINSNSFQGAS